MKNDTCPRCGMNRPKNDALLKRARAAGMGTICRILAEVGRKFYLRYQLEGDKWFVADEKNATHTALMVWLEDYRREDTAEQIAKDLAAHRPGLSIESLVERARALLERDEKRDVQGEN